MFCISLIEDNIEGFFNKLSCLANNSHCLVEIRLDGLYPMIQNKKASSPIPLLCSMLRKSSVISMNMPIIFTNRKEDEGGLFKGTEEERISWLMEVIEGRIASYVDIELRTETKLREMIINRAKELQVNIIVSYHDFNGTPRSPQLLSVLKKAYDTGCNIIKIVCTPKNVYDILTVMVIYREFQSILKGSEGRDIRLIAFSMGELGKITRVMSLLLGAPFSYCAYSKMEETARGQFILEEMQEICQKLSITEVDPSIKTKNEVF